jgi:hypothetical protein
VVTVAGVPAADLYVEMEVVWPSGVALRGAISNRPPVPWLKTVVLNGVGEVETLISAGVGWGDGRWSKAGLCRLKRRNLFRRHQNRGLHDVPGSVWGSPVYCPGGVRRIGSMNPT